MIKMPVLMKMYVKIRFVWSRDEDHMIHILNPALAEKHFIRTLILLLLLMLLKTMMLILTLISILILISGNHDGKRSEAYMINFWCFLTLDQQEKAERQSATTLVVEMSAILGQEGRLQVTLVVSKEHFDKSMIKCAMRIRKEYLIKIWSKCDKNGDNQDDKTSIIGARQWDNVTLSHLIIIITSTIIIIISGYPSDRPIFCTQHTSQSLFSWKVHVSVNG